MPDAGFYLWARTPLSDSDFARALLADYNVILLPGSYLARTAQGVNPGAGFVRIALVAPLADCVEAANVFVHSLQNSRKGSHAGNPEDHR
jgi:N-succinyldiaminopimelate aminotransferase